MTSSQLRAFVPVARLGSLTAAAAVLGISEPAVSSALASLLAVSGTPVTGRCSASTSSQGRLPPLARTLQRFVATPDATAAVVAFGSPHTARSR